MLKPTMRAISTPPIHRLPTAALPRTRERAIADVALRSGTCCAGAVCLLRVTVSAPSLCVQAGAGVRPGAGVRTGFGLCAGVIGGGLGPGVVADGVFGGALRGTGGRPAT